MIAAFVGAVPLYAVWLAYSWKRLTSKGVHVFLAGALGVIWAVVAYGSFVAPRALVVRHESVTIGEGAHDRTVRIALVSDTHLGGYRFQHDAARLVEAINAEEPDLVLLLGDIASTLDGVRMLKPFSGLRSRYGAYGVLGNWDYGAGAVDIRRGVESQGIEIMTNEAYQAVPGDDALWIAGVDDVEFGSPDLDAALDEVPEGAAVILASHNPDIAHPAEKAGVDLLVAGHTHGGQIRLPGIGSVPPLPTKLGRRYDKGMFEIGPMRMFLTSGAGESGPRARLFDPPEIVILTVTY
jgi:predicted MPP superfamily phosphohydrolase